MVRRGTPSPGPSFLPSPPRGEGVGGRGRGKAASGQGRPSPPRGRGGEKDAKERTSNLSDDLAGLRPVDAVLLLANEVDKVPVQLGPAVQFVGRAVVVDHVGGQEECAVLAAGRPAAEVSHLLRICRIGA